MGADRLLLHVICAGEVDPANLSALADLLELSSETVESDTEKPFDWSALADEINRQIDEVSGWILLVRPEEVVSASLAAEIADVVSKTPSAWAYRVRTVAHYCGGPLFRPGRKEEGEIRLLHSRRCRFLPRGEKKILQSRGTVIRLRAHLIRNLFDTPRAHRDELEGKGTRRTVFGKLASFLSGIRRDATRLTSRSIRYHWIEAGWEREEPSGGF